MAIVFAIQGWTQTPATLPYLCDFEDPNEISQWNLSNSTCVNRWAFGQAVTATGFSGTSMYISNDSISNAYTNSTVYTVVASRAIVSDGSGFYQLSFDFNCQGESSFDFVKVFVVPNDTNYAGVSGSTPYFAASSYTSAQLVARNGSNNYLNFLSGRYFYEIPAALMGASGNTVKLVFVWRNDGSGGTQPPAAIDNISIVSSNCVAPSALAVPTANITTTSADITWGSDALNTSFTLEYKLKSQTWTEAIAVQNVTSPHTLQGLTPNTPYDVRVKSDCSGSGSIWSLTNFRTACDVISSLPFSESFDDYGTGTGTFLTCWGRVTSNTYPYISSTNSSAPGSMYFYTASGAYNYIATPQFDASIPINTLSAFFKLYKGTAAYNITVGVMSDPADITTFDSIANLTPTTTSSWQTFGVDFTNYTGIGQYIAFKVQGYGATNGMYLDDITIKTTPLCSIPTGLTDYDSLATTNSMVLDWDATDDANVGSWILEYKPIDSTTWQGIDVFAHPYTLSGLQSGTVYQIRLYAICSSGDTTYATNTINVGLPCEVISTIPWYEGFESTWFVAAGLNTGTHPWCWTNINGGASTTYLWRKTTTSSYIHSGSGALQMYGANTTGQLGDWFISPTVTLTGNERLRFWAKGYSTYTDVLSVKILDVTTNGVVDAASDTSLFVEIMPNTIIPASDWIEYEVNLNQYTGDFQIAFVRNTTGGYYLNIDDVSITQLPNCVRPSNVAISSLESTSATISWTPGNVADASWYICYKASTATDYDSVLVNSNPYQIQGLNPQTIYNYYLRTDCGTELSEPTSVYTFTTPCAEITIFPYTESFDSLGATAGAFPPCWSRPVIYSTYPKTSVSATRVHSSPASLEIHSATGSPTYAITPPMGEDINTLRVIFWAMAESTTSSGTIEVGVMSDPNNLSTFESVRVIQPTNTSYNRYEVLFSGTTLTGLNRFIAFRQNTVSSAYYYWIDDVVVDYIPVCSKPAAVNVTNITTTSADVNWTGANPTDAAWWLYYKISSASSFDSVYISGTPTYPFTSLTPNTLYNIYLKTDCGSELSESTAITNFRTSCTAISSLPFVENFDTYGTGTPIFPSCWERINTSSTTYPYISTTNHSSPGALYFYAASGIYNIAVLPEIDASIPVNTLKARFWMRKSNATSNIIVGVMDSINASSFTPIDTVAPVATTTWEELEVEFSSYTGTGKYIAFKSQYNTATNYLYLDDVVIDIIPTCPRPDSLYAANVTQTTANIHFTPSSTSDVQWKLYYRQAGTPSWTDVDIFAIPYQLTGLTSNTPYEVYIKTLCSDATYSDASPVLSFRTPCDNLLTLPYTENFDTYGTGSSLTSYPTCWSRNVTTYANNNPYISTTNNTAPGSLYFYAYNNTRTVAVAHPVDLSIPMNTLMTTFKMRYSALDNNGIQVGVMTDPNDFATFVPVGAPQKISDINVWEEKAVFFTNYTGAGEYIALAAIAPSGEYARAYIDDFVIDYIPACPNVYGLKVVPASTTSVNVKWDNSGDQGSGYNIAYASNLSVPFDPTTATNIAVPTGTTIPYIIPGFNPGDSVWVAVQRGCNGAWTPAQKVVLPQSAMAVPYTQNFDDLTMVSEWMFASSNSTQTDMWRIGAATGNTGNSMYVSSDNGVTNSYTQTSTYTYASVLVEFGQASEFGLAFDWKGVGESCCDKFSVYALPVSSAMPSTGYPTAGTTLLAPTNQQSTWQNVNIILPSATYANTVQRLIFVWYSDGSTNTNPPAAVDNILITSTDCGTPTTLTATNITTTSADVSWTEVGTATSWYLYYKPALSPTYDSILVSGTPTYSFTTLTANTPYNVYVVANCGTQFSNNSNVLNFRTACDDISSLPYFENFEGYGTGTSIMPACWVRTTTYADRPYVNSGGYSGNCLYFYAGTAGTYNIAAMNPISTSIPINTLMATFYYKCYATTDRLIVGVMTDPTNAATFDSITTISSPTASTWAEYEVNFSSYTGTGTYIAFKNIYTTTSGYAYIDNLNVDIIPSCARPTSLSASGTGTSMDVTFTPGNSSDNAWYIYYKPATATDWDSVYSATIPTNIPGLTLQTTYQIYAKTVCSDGTNSNASQTVTYTTPCSAGAISSFPWTEGFENGISCWQQEYVLGTTSWTTTSSYNSAHAGTGFADFFSSDGDKTKLISPLFDISGLATPYVSFWHMQEDWSSDQDELKVFYRTSATGAWTQLVYYSSSIVNYRLDSVALPSPSATYQIAFEGMGDYGYGVALDDITVYDPSGSVCAAPTNLSVSGIQNTTATVSWIPAGTESAWQVRLGATGTAVDVANTTYSFPATLTPGTHYTYYVRANCGTNYSAWVQDTFTTTAGHQEVQVTTIQPTAITQTNATFQGTYVQGTDAVTAIGFEYKTTAATTWTDQAVTTVATPFTYAMTTLLANTNYEVRAYAVTATDGRKYGDTLTFVTLAIVAPTVTTLTPNPISYTSATFQGTIVEGSEAINARGFEYKLPSQTWQDANIISATGTNNITASVTTLQQATTYDVRAYARTASATTYGLSITFNTLNQSVTPPTVATLTANSINDRSATLRGTITAGSEVISNQGFEWKATSATTWTPVTVVPVNDTIIYLLTGIEPETNYEFKAFATTATATTNGTTQTFMTLGLNEIDGSLITVMMYPNPASEETKLVITGLQGDVKITISDVQGRIINTINTRAHNNKVEETINVSDMANGVYYVRLQNDQISRTQKLIVK